MVNSHSSAPFHDARPGLSAGSALHAVVAIAIVVALGGLGLAYGGAAYFDHAMTTPEDPALGATHNVTIGAQRYGIPASLFADPTQRRDGFAERIDLALALPLLPDDKLAQIDITLMPRGRMRSSAALLDSVYLHQFADEQMSGVPGLVGKPLARDAGTEGETVWYDPLSANPFVAKCAAPISEHATRTCLRVMTLSDRNTAIVAFDPTVLGTWRSFDGDIEAALQSLRR